MKPISAKTREMLKEDLEFTVERVESIKSGASQNYRVLDFFYTTPIVDDSKTVPLTDDKGEYHHYKEVGHMVLNILTQGMVPQKFRERLVRIKAPDYIMELMDGGA